MTDDEKRIVEWLRREAGYSQAVADDQDDFLRVRCEAEQAARIKNMMADFIESGLHRKD